MFTFISLFSGIGGLDLGLEQSGMTCVAQVEINPYCQRVLAKHWPHVQRFTDIRAVNSTTLPNADLMCGGFPCQDVSTLGSRTGITGKQSSLWGEYARLITEAQPRYVFIENVPDLLKRGGATVLSDLATMGYDAEWACFPASALGAAHRRDRIAIVAYPACHGMEKTKGQDGQPQYHGILQSWLDAFRKSRAQWIAEPGMDRMADGVPCWLDRLSGLGNAVVPAWARYVGDAIMTYESEHA